MKLYVGVTDNDWYRFLSNFQNVDEVKFGSRAQSIYFVLLLLSPIESQTRCHGKLKQNSY
jgi:hypothetical protein